MSTPLQPQNLDVNSLHKNITAYLQRVAEEFGAQQEIASIVESDQAQENRISDRDSEERESGDEMSLFARKLNQLVASRGKVHTQRLDEEEAGHKSQGIEEGLLPVELSAINSTVRTLVRHLVQQLFHDFSKDEVSAFLQEHPLLQAIFLNGNNENIVSSSTTKPLEREEEVPTTKPAASEGQGPTSQFLQDIIAYLLQLIFRFQDINAKNSAETIKHMVLSYKASEESANLTYQATVHKAMTSMALNIAATVGYSLLLLPSGGGGRGGRGVNMTDEALDANPFENKAMERNLNKQAIMSIIGSAEKIGDAAATLDTADEQALAHIRQSLAELVRKYADTNERFIDKNMGLVSQFLEAIKHIIDRSISVPPPR